jgi:hypothetical protein
VGCTSLTLVATLRVAAESVLRVASYVTLTLIVFRISIRTSLDIFSYIVIHEVRPVTYWLSPVRDPESRISVGCVLHSPPDKGL